MCCARDMSAPLLDESTHTHTHTHLRGNISGRMVIVAKVALILFVAWKLPGGVVRKGARVADACEDDESLVAVHLENGAGQRVGHVPAHPPSFSADVHRQFQQLLSARKRSLSLEREPW